MDNYDPKDLRTDTELFLNSQLGKRIVSTLQETSRGYLTSARNIKEEHTDRYLAKYDAIEEVLTFIKTPLDNNNSPRG